MKNLIRSLCILVLMPLFPAHAEDVFIPLTQKELSTLKATAAAGNDNDALKLAQEFQRLKKYTDTEEWYRYAIYKQNGRGYLGLYDMHQEGFIKLDNPGTIRKLGMNLILKEATNNGGSAALYLGMVYMQGNYISRDYDKAQEWLKQAEKDDKPMASYYLGLSYVNGLYRASSHRKALYHFEKASAGGIPDATRQVAIAYHTGIGHGQSTEKALIWYKKAAAQGSVLAMRDIASISKEKYGDMAGYLLWMKKAANLGDADANYYMGKYYSHKNKAVSNSYFKKAVSQKHHLARVIADKSYNY